MRFTPQSLRQFFQYFHKELTNSEISLLLEGEGDWNPTVETQKQLDIIQKYRWIFSFIPGLKAVFVCNTTAFRSAQGSSDIDLFVVAEDGKLWITRVFLTIFTEMFGIRRKNDHIHNQFCLSFFATENGALYLENLQIERGKDPYLTVWAATLECVFGSQRFLEAFHHSNHWVNDSGLHWTQSATPKTPNIMQRLFGNLLMLLGLEGLLKLFLLPRALKKKSQLADASGTVISDQYLKFHDKDIRKNIQNKII